MPVTLQLKEVPPYEMRVCDLSGQVMFGGDWYYQDTNGKVYLYEAYHEQRRQVKEAKFDLSNLYKAQSKQEYKQALKEYEQQVIQQELDTIFNKE